MADYTLISVPPGIERERFLPLLLLADESLQQVRSYMQRGELYAFVGADEVAVGIVLTIPAAQGGVELVSVAVDTTQQNRGIGRRMIEWLIETAQTAGVISIHVEMRAANKAAYALYRSMEFAETLRLERYYRGRETAIRMMRLLRPPGLTAEGWTPPPLRRR